MTLDDVRTAFPHLDLTLYAYQGQPVTLECISADGSIFTFTGATEHDAIKAGFGEELAPAEQPAPAPSNVFD
jgi:hypothetical protein